MKLKILLLLLIPLFSVGQEKQTITIINPDSTATKADVRSLQSQIKELQDQIGTKPKDCDRGPTILRIIDVYSDRITPTFDGENVTKIRWEVSQANSVNPLREGIIEPKANTQVLGFDPLSAGKYRLTYTAVNCTGSSFLDFEIKSQGGIDPPGDLPPYSYSPTILLDLSNVNGVYSDNTQGDFIEAGQRFKNEGGRKFKAFYWINEAPVKDGSDRPIDLGAVELRNGLTVTIRKIYYDATWPAGETFAKLKSDWWKPFRDNKDDGSKAAIYKCIVQNIVTNGGKSLTTGDLNRFQNPNWLDATSYVPKWYSNETAVVPDKPIVVQCVPKDTDGNTTLNKLYKAGVTHVWRNSLAAIGGTNGLITQAFMLSSDEFKKYGEKGYVLTRDQAREYANTVSLKNNVVVTDEFSEGQRPQPGSVQEWIYERFNERIKEEKLTSVQLYGEYAIRSVKLPGFYYDVWSKRDPVSSYAISLTGTQIIKNLNLSGGNYGDQALFSYIQSGSKYRGTSLGAYYANEHMSEDYFVNLVQNTLFQYNTVPSQPRILFTWPSMQGNSVAGDLWAYNPGWKRGSVINSGWHTAPSEFMKGFGFWGPLLYDAAYIWDDWGTINVADESKFPKLSISTDAFHVGARWYSQLISTLNEAGRDIWVADYSSNGSEFLSKTAERRLARKNYPIYNNTYFNEVGRDRRGFALVIPGKKKAFIYFNNYNRPDVIENVIVYHDGKKYNLGECPGSTLIVATES